MARPSKRGKVKAKARKTGLFTTGTRYAADIRRTGNPLWWDGRYSKATVIKKKGSF